MGREWNRRLPGNKGRHGRLTDTTTPQERAFVHYGLAFLAVVLELLQHPCHLLVIKDYRLPHYQALMIHLRQLLDFNRQRQRPRQILFEAPKRGRIQFFGIGAKYN